MIKKNENKNLSIQRYEYNGDSLVYELVNGDMMINATQMAKKFGKLPADFLRLRETKEYMDALSSSLSAVMGIPITGNSNVTDSLSPDMGIHITGNRTKMKKISLADIMQVRQGGTPDNQGTWMHRKLAIRFAQWLDPYFAVAVDTVIEQLLSRPVRLRPELAIPDDLPGLPDETIFTPDFVVIADEPIRRVTINGKFYYCLVDIQRAAGMKTDSRSQLSREVNRTYSFKIRTKANGKLASYISEEGINVLLSRSKWENARSFLSHFVLFVSPFGHTVDYARINLGRLHDIALNTDNKEDRLFLYELYKLMGGH